MTVGELERLLATLSDDTVVLMKGWQIEFIFKHVAGTQSVPARKRPCLDCGEHTVTEYEVADVPACIDLGYTIRPKHIYDKPPTVKLAGRWPRACKEALSG